MKKKGIIPFIGNFFVGKTKKNKPKNHSKTNLLQYRLDSFSRLCKNNNLNYLDYLNETGKSFLALTKSGSIICAGPVLEQNSRDVLYISSLTDNDAFPSKARFRHSSVIEGEIAVGKSLFFKYGPLQKSSPLIKLASLPQYIDFNDNTVIGTGR